MTDKALSVERRGWFSRLFSKPVASQATAAPTPIPAERKLREWAAQARISAGHRRHWQRVNAIDLDANPEYRAMMDREYGEQARDYDALAQYLEWLAAKHGEIVAIASASAELESSPREKQASEPQT